MNVTRAKEFATLKHEGQTRRSNGEPYVNHCIRVSETVAKQTDDEEVIIAALLHDTLEDTETKLEEISKEFGERVAGLVLDVTNNKEAMEVAGGKTAYLAIKVPDLNLDALLIKLADRLDNIADLSNDEWSKKYCAQTRHVFLESLKPSALTASHKKILAQIYGKVLYCESLLK